jgi:hypothetical protein
VVHEGDSEPRGDPILCGRWLELMVPVEPRPEFRRVWQRRNREGETGEIQPFRDPPTKLRGRSSSVDFRRARDLQPTRPRRVPCNPAEPDAAEDP